MRTRQRLTARGPRGILAEIDALERMVEGGIDEELANEAQGLAKEEAKEVSEAIPESVSEDIKDENARANKNWPLSASESEALARRLVAMAKRLMT